MTTAVGLRRALYEAVVDPGKGLAAAKRDYWYERCVSRLAERGIGEFDVTLRIPDPDTINPFFYRPQFSVGISPHAPEFDPVPRGHEDAGVRSWLLARIRSLTGRGGGSVGVDVPIYGTRPKSAYRNATEVYERWLHDLKERGFTVHTYYEFPRGLQGEIDEDDWPSGERSIRAPR